MRPAVAPAPLLPAPDAVPWQAWSAASHADYLANWLAVLKSDTTAVWQAATAASKASEFLLDLAASKAEKAAA